ncbi:Endonuclease/exonuclease/phosphatase [Microdochium trichocladiopsis]|uniref:Endonuclease/exonuclease/phosphatase n=1 Tax=Microdochium trichocladiopsis TaxID=1682393 RepID=A0A9P8YA56_9PEZI|nr:Endonuclease/exonuclease/phosphatase [Microdochium trichocladiopsis]KAH7031470.1 Endonuclease/exonuclease/phosphatase [Microdochium trichocladiopsis]
MPSFTTSPASAAKLLALLSCLVVPISARTTGKFSFLTYNVAGLPAFLSGNGVPGDKGTNANSIGRLFAEYDYDIIHVQEDFAYHAYIYATDDHPYRTPTTGTVPWGSGLNSLLNFPYTTLNRVKWDKCDLNEADCLTPKGFTMMRTQIASGVEVDLYNLHADAGGNSGDFAARSAGIDQILVYINANSAGRAVIIAGDTNDRYTNSGRSITKLRDAGFKDSWVERIKGGVYPTEGAAANPCPVPAPNNACEIVDKILYRSGTTVKLDTTAFDYEGDIFLQADGNRLSDHNPVRVEFTYSA